jgi:hypothetical protein
MFITSLGRETAPWGKHWKSNMRRKEYDYRLVSSFLFPCFVAEDIFGVLGVLI